MVKYIMYDANECFTSTCVVNLTIHVQLDELV